MLSMVGCGEDPLAPPENSEVTIKVKFTLSDYAQKSIDFWEDHISTVSLKTVLLIDSSICVYTSSRTGYQKIVESMSFNGSGSWKEFSAKEGRKLIGQPIWGYSFAEDKYGAIEYWYKITPEMMEETIKPGLNVFNFYIDVFDEVKGDPIFQ